MTREQAVFFEFFPMWLVILVIAAIGARLFFKAPLVSGLLLAIVTATTTAFATSLFPGLWHAFLLGGNAATMSAEDVELNQQIAVCVLCGASVIASGALYELLRDVLTRTLSLVRHREVSEHAVYYGGSGYGAAPARGDSLQDDEDSVE